MKIKLSAKNLILFQVIYNLIIKFFITDLHFPGLLNYGTDVINLLLFYCVLRKDEYTLKNHNLLPLKIVALLWLEGSISFILNVSSPLLYIWSLRNVYRFYVFFYCCIRTLKVKDIVTVFDILEKFLFINGVVCLFEYFVRGVDYDFLGGLFGNGIAGGNGPLNVLMFIVCSYVIFEYMNKSKSIIELACVIGICLFIAVVGEIKFFFFELILIVIYYVVVVKKNLKMVMFCLAAIVAGIVAMSVYVKIYPNNAGFLSLSFIQDYGLERTYGSSTDINRLSAISYIRDNIFKNDFLKTWLGIGMGNGETAQFSFLTSPFFAEYGDRIKYNWFSHAFMFVENGYIGVALYFGFFISVFWHSLKKIKENKWMQLCTLIIIEVIILVVYNQTLRVETMGYILFLIISMPYLKQNENERVVN